MRRTLGTLALLLSVAGCGSDTQVTQFDDQPAPDVTLVHATAGGGESETKATDVSDEADLAAYVAQFDDELAAKVTQAAGEVEGDVVLAQVVSVGCDVPPGASLEGDVIVPKKVADPKQECFAPVTTVALAG